jgi:type I restriction enzyme S subunit
MALTKHKLGEFTELYNKRCGKPNLTIYDISGVNADKEFFEPSKQAGADTSNYKNVPPDYFACNLMHVGRDKVLPIALNHSGKTKVVSPAYTIFRLKEGTPLLREYFFMMLKSEERDRYFWFHTDSSVRDGMSWDDFCDLEINIPPIFIQKKYVDIYNAMLVNQQSYERGLEDLKVAFDSILDKEKHRAHTIAIGELLNEIDNRNSDGTIEDIEGINITKQFMPTVANTTDINLNRYKVVQNDQIAYSGMQTGRDKCIRIALQTSDKPIIVSPAYMVFEVKKDLVLPEFIMMWFSRAESDRRGWFMSDSSVRSNLDLDRFYETEIPIPSIDEQRAIVDIYRAYTDRRSISNHLKERIKSMCPILIKGSLEEAGA